MNLSVGQKIFGIAFLVLLLMAAAAALSVKLISDVGDELDIVAKRQLPASEAVGQVTVHILEQGIVLQRLFVLSEDRLARADEITAERRRLLAFEKEIVRQFGIARAAAKDVAGNASADGAAQVDILGTLDKIAAGYEEFRDLSALLSQALEAGDQATFNALLPDLNGAQDTVNRHATDYFAGLQQLVERSAIKADNRERFALIGNTLLTILAAVLALLLAAVFTRNLVKSVTNLVDGTKSVEAGHLDTELQPQSNDEVGYLTESFNHMVGEIRLKERIKDTFGKYMDPRIVSNLLDDPEISKPGGRRREMTVMFIDLKGFTSISEAVSPDKLVFLINRFFERMTRAIADNRGVVDKFMGDAVMAYWGPPFCDADRHAGLACKAAIEARNQLQLLRDDIREELGSAGSDLDIDLRIGISTGEMIVGTVGSDVSRNFTVMGDPVNLGSRLEGANKAYGSHILVSSATYTAAKDVTLRFREMDLLRVKGKNEPVQVFELLAAESSLLDAGLRKFEKGVTAYRAQRWDEATEAFNEVISESSDDDPSKVYLERISRLRTVPPGADWDGVWILETK